jgi:hypothetical protein
MTNENEDDNWVKKINLPSSLSVLISTLLAHTRNTLSMFHELIMAPSAMLTVTVNKVKESLNFSVVFGNRIALNPYLDLAP